MQSLGTSPAATVLTYVQWNLWGWCKAQGFSWKLSVHHPCLLLHIETKCSISHDPIVWPPAAGSGLKTYHLHIISAPDSTLFSYLNWHKRTRGTDSVPEHRKKKRTKVTVSEGITTDLHCSLIWSLLLMIYDRLNVLKPMCVECLSNKVRGYSGENKHRQTGSSSSGSTVARHFSPQPPSSQTHTAHRDHTILQWTFFF